MKTPYYAFAQDDISTTGFSKESPHADRVRVSVSIKKGVMVRVAPILNPFRLPDAEKDPIKRMKKHGSSTRLLNFAEALKEAHDGKHPIASFKVMKCRMRRMFADYVTLDKRVRDNIPNRVRQFLEQTEALCNQLDRIGSFYGDGDTVDKYFQIKAINVRKTRPCIAVINNDSTLYLGDCTDSKGVPKALVHTGHSLYSPPKKNELCFIDQALNIPEISHLTRDNGKLLLNRASTFYSTYDWLQGCGYQETTQTISERLAEATEQLMQARSDDAGWGVRFTVKPFTGWVTKFEVRIYDRGTGKNLYLELFSVKRLNTLMGRENDYKWSSLCVSEEVKVDQLEKLIEEFDNDYSLPA